MKRGMGSGFPKPDAATLAFFESLVQKSAGAEIRPMFGNVAAFVNGNMFAGVFGSAVFVRLGDDERNELLKEPGAAASPRR